MSRNVSNFEALDSATDRFFFRAMCVLVAVGLGVVIVYA
jgi:hypothetical protein